MSPSRDSMMEQAAQICDQYAQQIRSRKSAAMREVNADLDHDATIAEMCAKRIRERAASLPDAERGAPDWEGFTEHLSWCATCAQDGLSSCDVGREIRAALDARPVSPSLPTQDGAK